MNLYEATVSEGAAAVRLGSQTIALPEAVRAAHPGLVAQVGRPTVIGLRPELLPAAGSGEEAPVLEGDVDLVESLGSEMLVHFTIDARRVVAEGTPEQGEVTAIGGEGVARVDARASMRPGSRARFAVDVERMQFFDAGSGAAVWD